MCGPGYCVAFDSAYVDATTSVAIPNQRRYPQPDYPTVVGDAYDAGFPNKFSECSDSNREQFQVDCPLLCNETIAVGADILCCTESQCTGLPTQVRMISGLCSACKENLRNVFCQFTCNPNNSMLLDINEVRLMPGDGEHDGQVFPAEEATYCVGTDWIRDIYDFCEDDNSFSLLRNPNQGCTDGCGLMEFMGEYAFNSVIMVPKDGGAIYRSEVLKEAIRVQNVAASVTYTGDAGETTVELDDICWKATATGTGCTVNSITQDFPNNLEHFAFYEKYGLALAHFSNCFYPPTTSNVTICTQWSAALEDGEAILSSMSDCPCLSAFESPMNLYSTYLGGFPDGAETNCTLLLESRAFVVSYLSYKYADDDRNRPAVEWEQVLIDTMKAEAASKTMLDIYFHAETSVHDEVDSESSNGMSTVALSYCLMILYISLGINGIKFSKALFISSKLLVGFCGVMSIACGVASMIGRKASRTLAPSTLVVLAAEAIAFAFGSISPMPVELWFAAMVGCSVALNFVFQMTLFLSVITLDKRRELSGQYDLLSDLRGHRAVPGQPVFYSLVIALTAANFVVLVLGIMQPLCIMLNVISMVNLIIAAGISMEFCGHYARLFAKARGTRKYYFRMCMMVVVCGFFNGKNFFLRTRSEKNDLPSSPITRAD
ncbi:hypothetical protein BBJ28_00011595 [Nothophytophthora sp. Chile5]|nr:hypothetical protein BBJ28_00011595 [Nothophytophthora sp. Chile5]